jgi:HTH-type transcriptional regulator, transcriptional repressor of NAD biosynthesis genes
MRRGLVIGKFYPPHLGHKFLIDKASANSDHVDVLVCERPDQSISGALRVAWLREMCPTANVMEVADICDDDNSERWATYVRYLLGRAPEVVFTSERYGEKFAHFLGCDHVMVDEARNTVPVSGTVVRDHPLRYWEYLAPCVRAYYAKRVCVLGAESTGTTTMAEALAKNFKTVWVPEYGREYAEAKLSKIDAAATPSYEWRSEEFEHISAEQTKREDQLAREANRILICDTDALATSVWHERYMGSRSQAVEEFAAMRKYDLYLLTDCDIEFVQDGTRDGESVRGWMTRRLVERLDERGALWLRLSGCHEERMKKAVDACLNLLSDT